jgi:hypothetical protein
MNTSKIVCIIAAGLTFLETIANPYATVLGPAEYCATRINLAQSCTGIGLIFGPIVAGIFSFYVNYVISQVPSIPDAVDGAVQNCPDFLKHWLNSLTEIRTTGAIAFSNKGSSDLVSVGLLLFLGGRFIGTFMRPRLSGSEGMHGVSASGGH